jgi:4-hydroxymandelate synthase
MSLPISVDYVEFYVRDADGSAAEYVERFGFETAAHGDDTVRPGRSIAVRQGGIVLVFTQGQAEDHPARVFVRSHGDGVADIAIRTADARAAFDRAVAAGARAVCEPTMIGECVVSSIGTFGDVLHTFVQRPDGSGQGLCPPGFVTTAGPPAGDAEFARLDHFAVCLPAGELTSTAGFYEAALGFHLIYEERIAVSDQAMTTKVVQSPGQEITLTLIEPDTSLTPGHIDQFVKDHGGPGVQHIAFFTDDIVRSVITLGERGVEFLSTPDAYYRRLAQRLKVEAHDTDVLRDRNILVDSDHDGQLFQIFTRTTHPRKTFFLELIERRGARTFGSGNIKALYEAVELERTGDT